MLIRNTGLAGAIARTRPKKSINPAWWGLRLGELLGSEQIRLTCGKKYALAIHVKSDTAWKCDAMVGSAVDRMVWSNATNMNAIQNALEGGCQLCTGLAISTRMWLVVNTYVKTRARLLPCNVVDGRLLSAASTLLDITSPFFSSSLPMAMLMERTMQKVATAPMSMAVI